VWAGWLRGRANSVRAALAFVAVASAIFAVAAQDVVDGPAAGAAVAGPVAHVAAPTHAPLVPVSRDSAVPVAVVARAEAMPATQPQRAARSANRARTGKANQTVNAQPASKAVTSVVAARPVRSAASPSVSSVATIATRTSTAVTKSKLTVVMRGNGHGHGMSQYGAQGAALAGKSYRQITGFYYPGTTVKTLRTWLIRVHLTNAGSTVTVAPRAHLVVTGVSGVLPTSGVKRYRLVAGTHSTLRLQRLDAQAGSHWRTVYGPLANNAQFSRTDGGANLLYEPSGRRMEYRGALRAVRASATGTSGGVIPVNVVTLDQYTAGVVPREMPISWKKSAVEAQALAARSYGRYAVTHPRSAAYDICDTTDCQVYGGKAAYTAGGSLMWTDAWWVAKATSNQVIAYKNKTIFAQFAASDGGWSLDGGKPYLVARADPYDNRASGDPYLNYSRTISASSFAHYFGLAKVTRIDTTRDGHGADGGRILSGYVTGKTAAGHAKRVAAAGYDFSAAVGAGTTWITLHNG
jgi:stage II sporulation protein D